MKRLSIVTWLGAAQFAALPLLSAPQTVTEPATSLPVAHEVDVAVVGGSSGGVSAAVEAAKNGARVFLLAPRPYLGEDICATYRLWLEPGEELTTELAREVFKASAPPTPVSAGVPFRYAADKPSASQHKDTSPPNLLRDGKWHGASNQSVQYDGDVTLTLDLGREQEIARVHVLVYQRDRDFEVDRISVFTSADGKDWKPATVITNDKLAQGQFEAAALALSAPVSLKAQHLQLRVQKGPEAKRVLLAEVVVEAAASAAEARTASAAPRPVKPMQVKRALDQALIDAGALFLYSSFPAELLRDTRGHLAGIVMANRSGRQAVVAKVIIDATDRGTVARLANAAFADYPGGRQVFSRIVVGGLAQTGPHLINQTRPAPIQFLDRAGAAYPGHEYLLDLPVKDGTFASFAAAEQLARDWTWTKEAVDGSEVLFQVPPDSFRAKARHTGPWPGADRISLDVFRPSEIDRLFVLNGCADLPHEAAAQLLRPANLMAVGARLGQAAATVAKSLPKPEGVRVAARLPAEAGDRIVREAHAAASPRQEGASTVPAEAHGLPVLGEYDVVVVGGGTGGAPAGIGAGRKGARTLVLEYLHGLGGVGTLGYISSYYHGNRVGFTSEVDQGVQGLGETNARTAAGTWNPEHKSEWYRQALRQAGVELWYGVLGTGALVTGNRVTGVVVATPFGRGVVLAKVVVDSTGNADIAAAAGAECRYIDEQDVAVQGTGLPPRELGQRYTNTDYTFVDDNDIFDIWRVLVVAKNKFPDAYDLGQLIDTRERRQIVGDFTLSPMDMLLKRTFPDTVVIARSNFDSHGFTVHPLFILRAPDREDVDVRVPWRCLLPLGWDGIIVTGLGVSAHRDALPCIRMQPDVQNQGYAAGVAAAMIAAQGCRVRELNIKALQSNLVEKGILPEGVLKETDSFPLSRERLAAAVARVADDYADLEVVLAQFDLAQPLLREALAQVPKGKARLIYAHLLAMMGDPAGAEELAAEVQKSSWDKGWRYTGMGQFGASVSLLDSYLIALGRSKSKAGTVPILGKIKQLEANSEFSHFRAVAMAAEANGDPIFAKPLASLLQNSGLSGHATTNIRTALQNNPRSGTDNTTRNRALSELVLARALYRCGDWEGLGEKILRQYAQDLHGHYARHAQAILRQGRSAKPKS